MKTLKWNLDLDDKMIVDKINELVDAVNRQQIDINNHGCRLLDLQNQINELKDKGVVVEPAENVRDKFAEQRGWIGKLCRFWCCLGDLGNTKQMKTHVGFLVQIDSNSAFPFYCDCGSVNYLSYRYCEPVKSTDSIIYKGGHKWVNTALEQKDK